MVHPDTPMVNEVVPLVLPEVASANVDAVGNEIVIVEVVDEALFTIR